MKKLVCVLILCCGLFGTIGSYSVKAQGNTYMAKVYADSLSVRSEGALQSPSKGALKYGEIVEVSQEAYGWLKIKSDKVTGWVAGQYLKKVNSDAVTKVANTTSVKAASSQAQTASSKSVSTQVTVLADSLFVREGPGVEHKVVGGLKQGDGLTVLKSENGWLRARSSDGQIGWVSERYTSSNQTQQLQAQTQVKGQQVQIPTQAQKSSTSVKGLKGKTIVIDPGHGGADPGMIGTTYKTVEKIINLSTSLYLVEELRERGANVVLTRTKDDQKPELPKRVEISGSAKADAFVSIHYNSSPKQTSGTVVFYYSATNDLKLARAIEGQLAKGIGIKSNGISLGDFHILRENARPSVLVELGFLSNKKDESIVRTASYQKKAASAIADGLENYFK